MKFLKALLGKTDAEPPKWDIKPPAERPPPKVRQSVLADESASTDQEKREPNPFLDDIALATLTLEEEAIPDDNPYATHTWEIDPENDTRKLKTIQIGEKSEKKPGSEFNPYDTGKMRRGWKK